ncbi:MAG TPA: MFS transporter, partial [Candidatus Avacidaminococcus intestinavium]|nr:MFS transporter [Candidatus Avacidaminococcus intestinavium]
MSAMWSGKAWLPTICLSFAAFVFNTTEFVPIALLSDIAKDLQITEPQAGTLITIYAWYVALFSLPLMLACAKVERRKLLGILFVIFIMSHCAAGLADSYTTLLISRLGIATA